MKQPCTCGSNCPISCMAHAAKFRRVKDETGKRFGKLIVVEKRGTCWLTNCDCGGFRVVDGRELRAGRATACKPCAKENQRAIVRIKGGHRGNWEREAA